MTAAFGRPEGSSDRVTGHHGTADRVRALATSYAENGESLEVLYADLDLVIDAGDRAAHDDLLRLAGRTWADAFMTRLNRLTCADPITGLSSVDHLTTHVEWLGGRGGGLEDRVLVVVDVVSRRDDVGRRNEKQFRRRLRIAVVADTLDAWFGTAGVVGAAVSSRRVAVVVHRQEALVMRAADLAESITTRLRLASDGHAARVGVVPLPAEVADAVSMIQDLGRPPAEPARAGSDDLRADSGTVGRKFSGPA
ncbi:hypothetical protein KVF89_14800 [Nocardioides carbamazepini]|uniref:hypothetical protein n=1 Tax=Nocardioides carbamazepini TaxID=2854259 RepID=UPI00214A45BA|nr:hypothetical protein [Nocardioides carbamazepini]MCR1783807.1 hypothetical protein [Nocardioides carbamazepini]